HRTIHVALQTMRSPQGLAFIHLSGDVRVPVSGRAFPFLYSELPMKSGRSLVDLARELERQLATKKDMVVPSSLMLCRTSEQGISSIDIDERSEERRVGKERRCEWSAAA